MASAMGETPLVWRARDVEWTLDRILVMGIVNVTPDSFTDGGKYFGEEAGTAHALRLADEGADILDIGGESTRPGARLLDAEGEWRRIGGVIAAVARKSDVPISVDTYKPDIARKAIRAGAVIVNDIHGLQDPEMQRVVANSRAGAVLLHMQGEPATMNKDPRYGDVVAEVQTFLTRRMAEAMTAGVSRETIVVDPGFGFGKSPSHNAELLQRLEELRGLGRPILVGVSGKSFAPRASVGEPGRLDASLEAAAIAILRGAGIVRVHDVAGTVPFVRVLDTRARRP